MMIGMAEVLRSSRAMAKPSYLELEVEHGERMRRGAQPLLHGLAVRHGRHGKAGFFEHALQPFAHVRIIIQNQDTMLLLHVFSLCMGLFIFYFYDFIFFYLGRGRR
jgi:hypothetical protein